jgi:probable phosphoglycerate mutase
MGIIILLRHGENDWSKKNKLAGLIPGIHLNEVGHRQSHAVAQRLAVLPIKAVYSSPVTRCAETATYVADTHRLSIQYVDELGEVEYGEWEGKKIKKLARQPLWRAVQFSPGRARFPKGETLREAQFRAVQALEEIAARHEKEAVIVVSHADIIRLLLAFYLGVHIDLFQRLVIAPASISVLALGPDGPARILRVNDDGPLHPPPEAPREGEEKKKGDKRLKLEKKRDKSAKATDREGAGAATHSPAENGRGDGSLADPAASSAPDEEE